jgi:hypothetical protein
MRQSAANEREPPMVKRASGGLAWAATAFFVLLAMYHVALTVSTVMAYGTVNPYAEDARRIHAALTLPFGVLPSAAGTAAAAFRWFEFDALHLGPGVQRVAAWVLLALAFGAVVREAWRSLAPDRALAAAAACVLATLLAWNANLRLFLLDGEALRVFFVIAASIAATLAAEWAAASDRRAVWWLAAVFACGLATLSLGIGIATFAALIAVAAVIRAGFATFAALVALAATVAALCLWAAPWSGWEDLVRKDGAAQLVLLNACARIGAVAAEIGRPLLRDPAHALTLAAVAGLVTAVPTAVSMMVLWLRGHFFTRLEVLAVSLFVFGVVANILSALGRAAVFAGAPELVLDPGLLVWSCVSWLGMGLFLVARLPYAQSRGRTIGLAVIAVLCVAAVPDAAMQRA